jgi:membrane protein
MSQVKVLVALLRQTLKEWNEDHVPRLAAALAYYTAFSLAPLLVVIIAVAGFIVSQDTVRQQILLQITNAMGPDAAKLVDELITNSLRPAEGTLSFVLGIITLLLGAIGVFGQFQEALNTIWGFEESKHNTGILGQLKDRILSFGMVLVVGFLLLVSLVVSTIVAAAGDYLVNRVPSAAFALQLVNFGASFAIIIVLFALIYKILPKVTLQWRDVWIGATITAFLFSIGKFLLGLYLGRSGVASAYGAAGSFVIILLWIYYSAQIVLFGAEFTQVYATRVGSHALSSLNAKAEAATAQAPPPTEKH